MDVFERVVLLKQSSVFSSVRTDDLRTLAPYFELEAYLAGDTVFEMGDIGEHMYLVQSGAIGIYLDKPGEEAIELNRLGRGDCFGEMGLLDELPRSASARVLEGSELLVLGKERLHGLIASNAELAMGMLKSLSMMVRRAGEMLRE